MNDVASVSVSSDSGRCDVSRFTEPPLWARNAPSRTLPARSQSPMNPAANSPHAKRCTRQALLNLRGSQEELWGPAVCAQEIAACMRQGADTRCPLPQVAVVLAVCALALTVCVALISTSELKAARPVALYGLGSGEEQEADNSMVTTFEVRRRLGGAETRD